MLLGKQAFRENGLNTMEAGTLVNRARLETLLSSLYSNLNKRLPPGQSIDIEKVNIHHFENHLYKNIRSIYSYS